MLGADEEPQGLVQVDVQRASAIHVPPTGLPDRAYEHPEAEQPAPDARYQPASFQGPRARPNIEYCCRRRPRKADVVCQRHHCGGLCGRAKPRHWRESQSRRLR